MLYIDSVPVHAIELGNNGQGIAIGACTLSGYYDVAEEIIVVFDNLLREPTITVKASYILKRIQLIDERITGWDKQSAMFDGVPHGHKNPKTYSQDLSIYGFMFFPKKPYKLSIKNIVISQNQVNFLNTVFSKANTSPFEHNENSTRNNFNPGIPSKKTKTHELREVIKSAYAGEKIKLKREPSNTEVWRVVQNLEYDIHEIINDVNNTCIEWSNWKNQSLTMQRSTFNNFISELKKAAVS